MHTRTHVHTQGHKCTHKVTNAHTSSQRHACDPDMCAYAHACFYSQSRAWSPPSRCNEGQWLQHLKCVLHSHPSISPQCNLTHVPQPCANKTERVKPPAPTLKVQLLDTAFSSTPHLTGIEFWDTTYNNITLKHSFLLSCTL